jgi:hypothetical protein
MLAFVGLVLIIFSLFALVFCFFYKFRSSMPYYRVDQSYCCFLLQHAIAGDLPCTDWYLFIGAVNLTSEDLEMLRLACVEIDEEFSKESVMVNGKFCMNFNQKGEAELALLLTQLKGV